MATRHDVASKHRHADFACVCGTRNETRQRQSDSVISTLIWPWNSIVNAKKNGRHMAAVER